MSALTDRDLNAQPTSNPANTDKTTSAGVENATQQPQQQKQLLKDIAESNGKPGQAYVSPSDAILSPASKKLSDFKQKQIDKKGMKKPAARTLFARNVSNCSSTSDDADIGGAEQANAH